MRTRCVCVIFWYIKTPVDNAKHQFANRIATEMIAKVIVLLAVFGIIAAQKPAVGTFDLPNGKPSQTRPGNVAVPIPQQVPGPARKTRSPQIGTFDLPNGKPSPTRKSRSAQIGTFDLPNGKPSPTRKTRNSPPAQGPQPAIGTFDLPKGKPSTRPAVAIPEKVSGPRKTRNSPPAPQPGRPAVGPAVQIPEKISGPRKTRSYTPEVAQRTRDIPKRQPY